MPFGVAYVDTLCRGIDTIEVITKEYIVVINIITLSTKWNQTRFQKRDCWV